jgi:hypothetical protein
MSNLPGEATNAAVLASHRRSKNGVVLLGAIVDFCTIPHKLVCIKD